MTFPQGGRWLAAENAYYIIFNDSDAKANTMITFLIESDEDCFSGGRIT
jgi:hypothetical protein